MFANARVRILEPIVALLLLAVAVTDARAQFPRSWSPAGDGSFQDPLHWNPNGVPGPNDGARFDLGGSQTVTFSANPNTAWLYIADVSQVIFDLNGNTCDFGGLLGVGAPASPNGYSLDVGSGAGSPAPSLTITDGTLNADSYAQVGNLQGPGSLAVSSGGNLNVFDALLIGANSDGSLNVNNGGNVSITSGTGGHLILGFASGVTGTALIQGGSSVFAGEHFHVGWFGNGSLSITSGSSASTSTAFIGQEIGSTGTVLVDGIGTTFNPTDCYVGRSGSGSLTVRNSAVMTTNDLEVAFNPGSTGSVTLASGATLNTITAKLGTGPGATATMVVTDLGTVWTANGPIEVGQSGSGTLLIQNGGDVVSPVGFMLGTFPNGSGTVTVGGSGALLDLSAPMFIGTNFFAGGRGTLNVNAGGAVTSTSFIDLRPLGTININGGTLIAPSINQPVPGAGTMNFNSGTLDLTGQGVTVSPTGLLGPTVNLSLGKELILGLATDIQAGGTLSLSGGQLTTSALTNTNGLFQFTGGTLNITGAGGLPIGPGTGVGANLALVSGQYLNVTNATTINNGGTLIVDRGVMTTGSVNNQAGGRLFIGPLSNLPVTGGVTNAGRLELLGTAARLGGGGAMTNTGLILGDGEIARNLSNNAGGEIRAELGKRLRIVGANGANAGRVNLQGGTAEFTQALTNAAGGTITGRGTLITTGNLPTPGLTNSGSIALSGGITDVFGDVSNADGGSIRISGNSNVTFWDDVDHAGALFNVSPGSSATFFGAYGGTSGGVSGLGTVYLEGDITPGASPAIANFGGNVYIGPAARLVMEVGGPTPGTQHDQVNVAGTLSLDGTLDVVLLGGYQPSLGSNLQLLTAGTTQGVFENVQLPSLNAGVAWSSSNLYTAGALTVIEGGWNVNADGVWSDAANWLGAVPNGVGQTANFLNVLSAPRTITLDASKTAGTIKLDNDNGYILSGPGTLTIDNGGIASINVVSGSHTISAPLSIAAGNVVTKSGPGTLTIAGPQSNGAGAVLTAADGTTNLNSDGGVNLAINANAATNFGSSQHLAALSVGPGATATLSAGGGKLLATSALGVDPTARLNLADNDLAVLATPATRAAVLADVIGKIATAFHGALWDQPGITSSAAAGDSAHLTTLGVILNDNGAGQPRIATFDGQTVDANSVLVKYTYYGDGDLSGAVDGTDYALIDNGFNFSLTGWLNGDFNYDGHVDGTDYAFIDNAFNFQGGPLSAGDGGSPLGILAPLQAVPEPGSLVLLAIGAAAMLCRSRRHNSCLPKPCAVNRTE